MKIENIEIYQVRMPLLYPWRTAYGSDAAIESILVRMHGEGMEGWGESCPMGSPCYSPEYAGGCFAVLRDWLAPRLIGRDILSGEDLQNALSIFKGNYFAKAALDAAWWDLHARILNQPLYRAIGGKKNIVEAGADFGVRDSVEELLDLIRQAVEQGVPRIKLKYAPGWDLSMMEKVREEFPDTVIHIDCNSAYTLEHLPMFRQLDALRLAMIEQPLGFDDLNDHAKLQKQIQTPLCLDESISSTDRARQAIGLKSCRWINIKPGRVGGLTNAIKIHDLCQSANVPCWVGGMLESSVGAMACAALATLDNFEYPADLFPFSKFYTEDIAEPAMVFSSPWHFTLLETPGAGVLPNLKRLKKASVQKARAI